MLDHPTFARFPNLLIWHVCARSLHRVDASFHGYVCCPKRCPGMLMPDCPTYCHITLVLWHPNSLTHGSMWDDLRSFANQWNQAKYHSAQHQMGLNNCDQILYDARSCRIAIWFRGRLRSVTLSRSPLLTAVCFTGYSVFSAAVRTCLFGVIQEKL